MVVAVDRKDRDSIWRERIERDVSALETAAVLISNGIKQSVIDADQVADLMSALLEKMRGDLQR